jgi:hypothetical protein
MKTPMTAATLAIKALADSIAQTTEEMHAVAGQAQEAAELGELNGTVGALMHVQARLESLQAQLAAVLALHRSK